MMDGDFELFIEVLHYYDCQVTEELTAKILYQWNGSASSFDFSNRRSEWLLKEYYRTRDILDEMHISYLTDSASGKDSNADTESDKTSTLNTALNINGFQDCAEHHCRPIPCFVDDKQVSCMTGE